MKNRFMNWVIAAALAFSGLSLFAGSAKVSRLYTYDGWDYKEDGTIAKAAFVVTSPSRVEKFSVAGVDGTEIGAWNGKNQVFLVDGLKYETQYMKCTVDGEDVSLVAPFTTTAQMATRQKSDGKVYQSTISNGPAWWVSPDGKTMDYLPVNDDGEDKQVTYSYSGWSVFTDGDYDVFAWPETVQHDGRRYIVFHYAVRAKDMATAPYVAKCAIGARLQLNNNVKAKANLSGYGWLLQQTSGLQPYMNLGLFTRKGHGGVMENIDRTPSAMWFGEVETGKKLKDYAFDNTPDPSLVVPQPSPGYVAVSWQSLDLSSGDVQTMSVAFGNYDAEKMEEDRGEDTPEIDGVVKRLSFIVEGEGRVHVNGVDSRHTQDGTETVRDYTALEAGKAHDLKGVSEQYSGQRFYAWFSNTLQEVTEDGVNHISVKSLLANPNQGTWVNIGCTDEIDFTMPARNYVLKAAFRDPAEGKATVRIVADPQGSVTALTFDGKDLTRDPATGNFTATDVPFGTDHALIATTDPLAGSEVLWITNGVAAASGNPFASLAVFGDLVVTARCTKAYKELTVELEDGPFIYCAEQLKPDVISVTDEDGNSYGPGDYTVEYGENTDAGEDAGSVTVKLTLPRSGEVTEHFDIQPRALDAYPEATVTVTGRRIHSKESAGITVEIGGRTLTEGTDYEVTIWQDDPSIPVRYAQIDGRGNYTGTTFSDDFYWLDTVEHDDGTYYADYDPNAKVGGKVPVVLFDVDTDVEARDGKYVVPEDFTEGSTQYTVVGIEPGAFTNSSELVRIEIQGADTEILGNILWGLDDIEEVKFPGQSPYFFLRYGEDQNGAAMLFARDDDAGLAKCKLLGTAAAGDRLSLTNEFTAENHIRITGLASSAFAGNLVLKEVALCNDIVSIDPADDESDEPGLTEYPGVEETIFTMETEPNDAIKDYFLRYDITWFEKESTGVWMTFDWDAAEAQITTPEPVTVRRYTTFDEAVAAARNGETVTVLKDISGDARDIAISGKRVLVDADGKSVAGVTFNIDANGSLGIIAGTFDQDYTENLVPSERFPEPAMEKSYDAEGNARWTVIPKADVKVYIPDQDRYFATVASAVLAAEACQTVQVVAAAIHEDVVFDKQLTFVFGEEAMWTGKLTAKAAAVTVKGVRAATEGACTFAVEGVASVNFDYSPAQHAVADPSKYAIFRTGESLWRLLPASLQVAKDTEDDDELFTNMNLAAKLAASGKITVTKTNDQDIDAANDFEIVTAADVVYGGWIHANGQTVTTALDSVFSQNLIDEFDWSNGLTLAYGIGGDVYTVVRSDVIVAQFTFANGVRRVCFTGAEAAVAALKAGAFNPIDEFQIGLNDTSLTYDFQGAVKKDGASATFKDLVAFGTGTNTIKNAELCGTAAVTAPRGGDAAGTVIFDKGVRMTNSNTRFTDGDITLIVKKGAYVNDPSEFCEEGTFGTQRAKPDLTGMFVIYPEDEIAVIADGVRYHTLQDAFDLAADGATIALFNDIVEGRYVVPAGKSFTLTTDAAYPDADTVSNATIKVDGSLRVENIVFDNAQLNAAKNMGAVLTIGDGVSMTNRPGGAIVMTTGNTLVIDTTETYIYDNVKADGSQQNVVLEDASILVLNKSDFKGKVGLYMCNFVDGTKFDGEAFGKVTAGSGIAYPDGDITCPEIRFVNDRDPAMTTGMGRQLAQVEGERFTRWVNGFDAVQAEGQWLLSRKGNRLVWLEVPKKPTDAQHELDENAADFVGRTAYTVTIRPKLDDAYGRDYAVVLGSPAVTNWVSMTDATYADTLAWNGNDRTFTFENLEKNRRYTVLTRRSISPLNTVSPIRVLGWIRTAKYDAMEIAKMFYEDVTETLPKVTTLAETAGNAAFVTVTTAGNAGNGYVVTLQRDLGRGADLKDDMGRILLQMNGQYLNAKDGDEGITFTAAANYNEYLPTDLLIVNNTLTKPGRIVGATGADGDATDADGKDGATGIRNASGNMVYVTVNGGVEVYGGTGGNGANRVNDVAGKGGDGGDAISGIIDLTVNGGALFGGKGGNGGESTNGEGGNGGSGGAGAGDDVTGEVVTGGIYGGNGGNGGGSGNAAGVGGVGGNALSNLEGMILQGGDSPEEIEVIAGKGGTSTDPAKAGKDGKGGKPEAPAAPTVKYVTGESVTLNVEPSTEYLVFKTADGAPSVEKQVWIKTGPQEKTIFVNYDTLNRNLVKATGYTVWARTPAGGGNLVSFYSAMTFTTLGHDAGDLVGLFKGKATVEEKDGVYVVTLTDDIAEGVEIPDNLGTFKLDMGGWSITGRDGSAAAGVLDGEAAITFTAANDAPAKLTRMIIVGNGDNAIIGGNGADAIDSLDDADGDFGGEGGNGFAVADNFVKRVVVDFENGTLAGGNGGDGADSVNGNGGDGGNGGDAYDNLRLTVIIGRNALALGGEGGDGGDVYGGIAGNGGNGGNAIMGNGGNAGCGGKADPSAGGLKGQDGVGGDGRIPGGAPTAYVVKLTGAGHPASGDFYASFEEGVLRAQNGDRLTVVRDCVFDGDDYGEVEVTANDLTIATAPGVTLTWNGTLRVASGVTGFVLSNRRCQMSEDGTGTLIVDGEATLGRGVIANIEISFEGQVELRGATVGKVAIEQGGRLTVPVNATSLVKEAIVSDKGGFADKSGVFLFGGLYGFDPGLYRRDPFMVVTEGDLWRIVQDPKFTAMAQVGTKIWGIETIDEAFAEIANATDPILVYLLKDSVAHGMLTDQAKTAAVIIGNGYTIVDAREDEASEGALFNLSGNLVLRNVTFDGQGAQKGKFIELFEAKTVVMDGCTVTGYACEALNGIDGKLPLISAAAAGMTTALVLVDTAITGNNASCAVSLADRSGSGFEYQLLLSGATTITDNGDNGIVASKFGSIVMAGDLTGGYIDVAYAGLADGKFALAADKYRDGADHFRSEATKECGSVIEEGGRAYVKWGVDERQYAAKIGTTLYTTIEEALEAVQDGDTLVLEQDAEITRSVTVRLADSADSFTLDLNGKKLTNSANKLKFGTGTVTIKNGTLAKNDTRYALYLYGAAVELEDVTVDSDIYVARGWLVIGDADVNVKGVIAKTNAGSVSLSEGLYTENPAAYVTSGRSVAAGDYGDYSWKIVAATEVVGFADGFILDTTPDEDGNIALDLTGRDAFGVLREGAKVILNGYVVNKVSVETPKGWTSTVTYDPANGKTVVLFAMDEAVLKPELGSDNPGDRPLEVVTVGGQVTQVTLRVKNAVKGFWYQMTAASALDQDFVVAKEVQATENGNLSITLSTTTDHFFKLNVADRPAR